jgi:phenylalanine-4-hydroxylase
MSASNNDWIIDQQWAAYTRAEHATWRALFERQAALLPRYACREFIDGIEKLPMRADQIPNFTEINEALRAQTGWSIVAVPGLVPDDVFFNHLAHRRFPSGNFIRAADSLDYIEAPDVFHDVFGHVPMLMNPAIADFIQAYGEGGMRAHRLGVLPLLARVYWYTVEFGLVKEHGALKVYGAGIASSFSETQFAMDDSSPNHIAFDLPRVMRTQYRIDDFQESYFALDSLNDLLALSKIDFAPLYERYRTADTFTPGALQPHDAIIARGTGAYHVMKTQSATHRLQV